MGVSMVGIGKVRVGVFQRRMAMRMGVLLAWSHTQCGEVCMVMLMVVVVRVLVLMLDRLMDVGVLVRFRQMKPNTPAHQRTGSDQSQRDGLASGQGQRRSKERRH